MISNTYKYLNIFKINEKENVLQVSILLFYFHFVSIEKHLLHI
jgi:hypothetical protein